VKIEQALTFTSTVVVEAPDAGDLEDDQAAQREVNSAASVVRYGQLAVADVAAVASAAEAIDEVT